MVTQKHDLLADEYVVAEARRNTTTKANAASVKRLDNWLKKITVAPTSFNNSSDRDTTWLPDKDRPVLAAAISLNCDALVTGDVTHFGSGFGKSYSGVTLYSPRMLYDHIVSTS